MLELSAQIDGWLIDSYTAKLLDPDNPTYELHFTFQRTGKREVFVFETEKEAIHTFATWLATYTVNKKPSLAYSKYFRVRLRAATTYY